MAKTYNISQLFFTQWKELSVNKHAAAFMLMQQIQLPQEDDEEESLRYGATLISILRLVRRSPLLVDKINEEQAVACFNDLAFLREPWYYFPHIEGDGLKTPEDELARHTFDHFIYADNEFSSFIVTDDQKFLKRLVATLYQEHFDKESVQSIADKIKATPEQLAMVLYTFSHVRNFVTKRCETLLPKANVQEDDLPAKPQSTGAMWLTLKHRLAETPAFQGYDTAGRANMYSALDYLEDLAKQKADAKT